MILEDLKVYESLLEDNRGLLVKAARKYAGACQRDSAIDVEDLMQVGFLGLVEASRTFDKNRGVWSEWAFLNVCNAMKSALGMRSTKAIAHLGTLSLNVPLSEDDDTEMIDSLEDKALPPIDYDVILEDTRRMVRECVADLKNDRQREVVQRWGLESETQSAVAERLGVSVSRVGQLWHKARQVLARDRRLRALHDLEMRTPYYVHVGVKRFNTTRTSATERAALWRLEHEPTLTPLPE